MARRGSVSVRAACNELSRPSTSNIRNLPARPLCDHLTFAHSWSGVPVGFVSPGSGNVPGMSIDLHDQVSAGRHAAKQARRRALETVEVARETVEAARDVDLHGPAQAAKKVAKRAAKRAAREAQAAAKRASRRKAKRASRRVVRVIVFAVVAGAVVGAALAVAQRRRDASSPHLSDISPDPFGAAVTETEHEGAGV